MMVGFWLAVVFLAFVFFGDLVEKQFNPNQHASRQSGVGGVDRLELKANRSGHFVVDGSINGLPVVFLVDTGATDVVVPASLARQSGMPEGRRQYAHTANGTVEVFDSRIDELSFGGMYLFGVDASINPSMEGVVLLGMSALRQFTIRHHEGKLLLERHDSG